jgi:L-asparaginase II
MHRYPALVSGVGNGDAAISINLNAAAKRGAAGCIGVAIEGRLGVAVKSWDGIHEVANSAAIATLAELGEVPHVAAGRLGALARPRVLGGGRVVGELEPRVSLQWA